MSEKQNIEYKASWRDEYLKWICGFANAQGGKIFIGLDLQDLVVNNLIERIGRAGRGIKYIPKKNNNQ